MNIILVVFLEEAFFAHTQEMKRSPGPECRFADNHCQRAARAPGGTSPLTDSSPDFYAGLQWRSTKRNGERVRNLSSHQPTTISSSISKTFHRENASTTSRKQKMLSKSSMNPEAGIFFCYRNNQTLLMGKIVVIEMVPILINKGVFD